jgi:hypothetical protein
MVDDDFTQTLNAFATKFKVPPAIEIYALAPNALSLASTVSEWLTSKKGAPHQPAVVGRAPVLSGTQMQRLRLDDVAQVLNG